MLTSLFSPPYLSQKERGKSENAVWLSLLSSPMRGGKKVQLIRTLQGREREGKSLLSFLSFSTFQTSFLPEEEWCFFPPSPVLSVFRGGVSPYQLCPSLLLLDWNPTNSSRFKPKRERRGEELNLPPLRRMIFSDISIIDIGFLLYTAEISFLVKYLTTLSKSLNGFSLSKFGSVLVLCEGKLLS